LTVPENFHIENRTINIPAGVEDVFVAGDALSKIITFTLPRYFDGVDLSGKTIKVKYTNALDQTGEDAVSNIQLDMETFSFDWTASSAPISTAGALLFAVVISGADYIWQTKPAMVNVEATFASTGDATPTDYTLEEIFYQTYDNSAVYGDINDTDSPIEIIGRDILMPPMEDIVVAEDSRSQVLSFRVNRWCENVDLAERTACVKYQNALEESDRSFVINLVVESEYITFGWLLDSKVAKAEGAVDFAIEFLGYDDRGDFWCWQTKPSTFVVAENLSVDGEIEEPDSSWLQSLMISMDGKVQDASNAAAALINEKAGQPGGIAPLDDEGKLSNTFLQITASDIPSGASNVEERMDGHDVQLEAIKNYTPENLKDPGWYPTTHIQIDNMACAALELPESNTVISISNGSTGEKVYVAGVNLLDNAAVTHNYLINSSGEIAYNSSPYAISPLMRVPPGQKLTISRCKSYIFYGSDGSTVDSYSYKSSTILRALDLPGTAEYMRFDCLVETVDMSEVMAVFGEYTAETMPAFTPYNTLQSVTIGPGGDAEVTAANINITLFTGAGTTISAAYGDPWYKTLKDYRPPTVPDPTRILLPDEIVAVAGEKLQIFTRGIIESANPYSEIVTMQCDIGRLCPRYAEIEPASGDAGMHELTVNIMDKYCSIENTASTDICVVVASHQPTTNVNILCFGDSLTANGERIIEMHRRLCLTGGTPAGKGYGNITFIGDESDSGGAKWVGHGGWTWQNYLELTGANPFYNAENSAIDFVNFCSAVGAGGIDIVYVLLGWNQLGAANKPLASDHAATISAAKTLIDKLKLDYPNVQVRILGLQMPSPHGGLGANYGMNSYLSNYYPLARSAHGLNLAYQAWANEEPYSAWMKFLAVAPCFDSDFNMPYNNATVNARNASVTEQKGSNGVHPAIEGYHQIADVQFRDFIRTFCS
jgi:hypothetical protein